MSSPEPYTKPYNTESYIVGTIAKPAPLSGRSKGGLATLVALLGVSLALFCPPRGDPEEIGILAMTTEFETLQAGALDAQTGFVLAETMPPLGRRFVLENQFQTEQPSNPITGSPPSQSTPVRQAVPTQALPGLIQREIEATQSRFAPLETPELDRFGSFFSPRTRPPETPLQPITRMRQEVVMDEEADKEDDAPLTPIWREKLAPIQKQQNI